MYLKKYYYRYMDHSLNITALRFPLLKISNRHMNTQWLDWLHIRILALKSYLTCFVLAAHEACFLPLGLQDTALWKHIRTANLWLASWARGSDTFTLPKDSTCLTTLGHTTIAVWICVDCNAQNVHKAAKKWSDFSQTSL